MTVSLKHFFQTRVLDFSLVVKKEIIDRVSLYHLKLYVSRMSSVTATAVDFCVRDYSMSHRWKEIHLLQFVFLNILLS